MKTSIFLVDDHHPVRDGLRALLSAQENFTVIGEAENGKDALLQIPLLLPQLVLLDITLPDITGIEVTRLLQEKLPEIKIIIISVHADSESILRSLRAGAQGYLLKESAGTELLEAICAVCAGQQYISHKVIRHEIQEYIRNRSGI